jgi:hypothetical protein
MLQAQYVGILSGLFLMSKFYQDVFCFEDCPNVVMILDTFEVLRNTLHTGDKHWAKRLYLMFRVTSLRRAVENWIDVAIKFPTAMNVAFLNIKRWSTSEGLAIYNLQNPLEMKVLSYLYFNQTHL